VLHLDPFDDASNSCSTYLLDTFDRININEKSFLDIRPFF